MAASDHGMRKQTDGQAHRYYGMATRKAQHATHASAEYYLCRADCRTRFVGDPARYLNKDESMVTGESMLATKTMDDAVIGGTLSRSGALVIRAEKIGRDTMLSRIVPLVAYTQQSRAPIQRMVDRVSGWFVPAVLGVVAILAFIAWSIWRPEPRLAHGRVAAVAVLIIACPRALRLDTSPIRSSQ